MGCGMGKKGGGGGEGESGVTNTVPIVHLVAAVTAGTIAAVLGTNRRHLDDSAALTDVPHSFRKVSQIQLRPPRVLRVRAVRLFALVKVKFSVALRPQRPQGLLGTASPGRPPRLSHSSRPLLLLTGHGRCFLRVSHCRENLTCTNNAKRWARLLAAENR